MSTKDSLLLKLENIKFSYDGNSILLDNLSLNLMNNEIVSLIGNNGAGKSTLLKVMAKLLPYEGVIAFNDSSDLNLYSYKEKIAYLPDKPILYDSLSAYQNLNLICNLWLIKDKERYMSTAKCLLIHFNLINDIDRLVEDYSLGMRDKLYFIACIAREPTLLLMDEPFSSWDKDSFDKGIKLLREYVSNNNCAVVFVSHSESLRELLADRVLKLQEGKLSQMNQ